MEITAHRQKPFIANSVFGMLILVVTEVMFFVALISTFIVIKAGNSGFQIPEDIRLPVMTTAFNTAILFLSGLSLFIAGKERFRKSGALPLIIRAAVLGAAFVAIQGYEWVKLIGYGLSMSSSIFGACFYLLIGTHALHAAAGVGVLTWLAWSSRKELNSDTLRAVQIFWGFIVGIWPVLYIMVYF